MKNKIEDHEINLSELIFHIIENKFKIFLIIFITLFVGFAVYILENRNFNKIVFLAETDVVANSIFEDFEYRALNNFIENLKNKKFSSSFDNQNIIPNDGSDKDLKIIYDNFINYNFFNTLDFEQINRMSLYKLFDEKLHQKDFFIRAIKKYDFIDKKQYNNNSEYEKAVLKLITSIKVIREVENEKTLKIKFETSDKEKWEDFLYSVEKFANEEIQNYLKKRFNLLISNTKRLNNYLLEDIEFEILNTKNNNELYVKELTSIKRRIKDDKNTERMINLFKETPIIKSNSNNFVAAKIKIQSTEYKDITEYPTSMKKIIFVSILLGVLLGIIYVLIQHLAQNRR